MVVVLTLDQRHSRWHGDEVPTLLKLLDQAVSTPPLRAFQRTAGDEVQAVVDEPVTTVELLGAVLRTGRWHVGVGIVATELPLPDEARAGLGAAYLHAREALTRAKTVPHRIRVVGGVRYAAGHLETSLWLWAGILERRSERGWQVHDALTRGLSYGATGRRLGISQSAVSQRAQAAGLADERRVRALVRDLLAEQLGRQPRQEQGTDNEKESR